MKNVQHDEKLVLEDYDRRNTMRLATLLKH